LLFNRIFVIFVIGIYWNTVKKYILYLIFGTCLCQLHAQKEIHSDKVFSVDVPVNSYLEAVGNHAIIYTGQEEIKYPNYILNHPYLDTDKFREGILSFDGILYPNVRMRLNLHKEELVVFSPDNRFAVVVPKNRVEYAIIDSFFVFHNSPETGDKQLTEGYHVRMYKGNIYEVWKRETAFLESKIKDMQVEFFFTRKKRFYLYKDDKYYPVRSKNSVIKLLNPALKKEIKKYIKQQKLNFNKSPDEAIVSVIYYYETLSQ